MKTDRLISIILTLLDQKRVSARELAAQFEVSPRTIYRDIDAINLAGIPVHAVSGVGGGFEIMPEYKIDKTVFSTADLSAILLGLSNLSDMVQGEELVNVLAKIKHFIPTEQAKELAVKTNQIWVDLSPWMGNQNFQPHLQTIKTAIEAHNLLSFAYIAHHGNQTVRTIEPYQLVLKSGHWYVYGYCRYRNDYRLFRLSRMSDLQMKQEIFIPREVPKPRLDETLETIQTEIKLRIHKSVLDRVLEFCPYDRFAPDGEAHYLVTFPFIENDYYYDILLGFGANCECLGPPHIRAELTRRIHRIAALYDT